MLPATARLTRAQCSELLKNPKLLVVFNRLGTLKYLLNVEMKGFSVITGSKAQKKAVLRNKLRRQLYSLFAQYYKDEAKKPISGMLYVSKGVYELSFSELSLIFNDLLAKTQK
ncbi:MAG TPA: ribonuclease P protein component [Candidatus Paceibacterota bacterium]